MKWLRLTIILLLTVIVLTNCAGREILYPGLTCSLFSDLPEVIAFGDNETGKNSGYGHITYNADGAVTYPALFLSNNDAITGNAIILITDYTINKKYPSLHFQMYLNYAEKNLKNLEIDVIPLLKPVNANNLSYDLLINHNYLNTDKKVTFYFTIDKTITDYTISSIPLDRSNRYLQFNLKELQNDIEYGFVLYTPFINEPGYITSEKGIVTHTGTLEFASNTWETWNGTVPDSFTVEEYRWKNIKNEGYKTKKYSPALIGSF
ncbi:MAG: hypothetical protein A2015_00160 [Spirochaetes bacterium GWF1_31_7]|nr:MAG: hypothetical protein A2Y30_04350 [Spirochaetes bacterium GWE1_32_154]OHD45585.1 MAG: hypothetical protein A2Y29_10355 [Spirochaetes bacterium GWE2_31_10]OHD51003.1 MAG: hypothetical protein A2015_00160 [Spirochaetes bacterium GWF1_31_7]HBD94318.1 hypothetical protein [Spirochaetia bacterium]HBI37927.1 hypothetical protein [Spirochaetia bacterium]